LKGEKIMAIGILLGILIAVFAIVAIAVGVYCSDNGNDGASAIAGIVAVALVITFICVPFSFHTVSSGEVAVVKHLGKIEDVKTAGTHYDFWMMNSYTKYDTKVQNLEAQTAAYSSDAQTMDIQMTIQYQIISDKVVDIATQYGKLDALESRINSIALEKTKSVLSSHKAMDIIANRATISPAVETAIKDAVGEEYFVNIVAVVITNIDFSDAFELAVEEKMIAEQAKLKADYENETKVAKAEAEAQAKLKAAQAEIEIAKAQAEALKIAAQAEAEANKIIDASITDKIIDKIIVDAWDGKMPTVVGNGDYILPSDILG
jgi:regulator of protease activity HflC (stomatin/prohibitin superfamily)